MANNRMFLVNRRTGVKIYLAKYYPSTGWMASSNIGTELSDGLERSDFGYLGNEEEMARRSQVGLGGEPYANYDPKYLMLGDQWELEYDGITKSK